MNKCLKPWSKLLAIPIILIVALIAVYLGRKGSPGKNEFMAMPEFDIRDDQNRPIKSETLKNKYVLVYFLSSSDDIEILRRTYFEWESEIVVFIVVNNEKILQSLQPAAESANFHLVSNDAETILSAYSSPHKGSFYLYDLSGRLASSGGPGDKYDSIVKQTFNKLIKGKRFTLSELLGSGEDVQDLPWFSQIKRYMMDDDKKFYLVAMFRNICQGCGSGSIVRALNEVYKKQQEKLCVICIVNKSFNDADIRSLKSQLEINYHVAIADDFLSEKWERLADEYSLVDITDMVFLFDSAGHVLKAADKSCGDCVRILFSFLEGI